MGVDEYGIVTSGTYKGIRAALARKIESDYQKNKKNVGDTQAKKTRDAAITAAKLRTRG